MAKTLLIIFALLGLEFILVSMYCALVVAGHSDESGGSGDTNKGDYDMFLKKQICPRCKTGKYTYELDRKSVECPNIGCWKDGKCPFYVPLEKPAKPSILKRNKRK